MPEENELQMSSDAILSIRCGVIHVSKLKQFIFVQTKKKTCFSFKCVYLHLRRQAVNNGEKKVRQNYKARQNN